ncbi:YbhB/YbcL family Raf kinase inhibitor-like protein [Streptomyces sp. ME03-5709C]|nr:YbhB/YbcL family Raf kinase inhibitor-like protein [Streptomyces sp. ME03-5709C]
MLGAGGSDVSPQLIWSGFPRGTKSFAVTVHDPTGSTARGSWHWAVADIPAAVNDLPTGAGDASGSGIPDPGRQLFYESGGMALWAPLGRPAGGEHTCHIVVHAVDVATLSLDRSAGPALLGFDLATDTSARAVISAGFTVAG